MAGSTCRPEPDVQVVPDDLRWSSCVGRRRSYVRGCACRAFVLRLEDLQRHLVAVLEEGNAGGVADLVRGADADARHGPLASFSSSVNSGENWSVPSLLINAIGCISLLYNLAVGSCVPLALARALAYLYLANWTRHSSAKRLMACPHT
eukprot:scaffold1897_cov129-Isochrysis_galbana.AAC.1